MSGLALQRERSRTIYKERGVKSNNHIPEKYKYASVPPSSPLILLLPDILLHAKPPWIITISQDTLKDTLTSLRAFLMLPLAWRVLFWDSQKLLNTSFIWAAVTVWSPHLWAITRPDSLSNTPTSAAPWWSCFPLQLVNGHNSMTLHGPTRPLG